MKNKIQYKKYRFEIKEKERRTILIDQSGEYEINLVSKGAEAQILGAFIGKNKNDFVIKTVQNHLAPQTKSNLLIKSVLYGTSKLRFNGLIRIDKKAQGADAYQRNENLLMKDGVKVESSPQLEILANNVRCTHGVTMGRIDQEQLFYLGSRGLKREDAEKLIIEGFFEGILEKIEDDRLKKLFRRRLSKQLVC